MGHSRSPCTAIPIQGRWLAGIPAYPTLSGSRISTVSSPTMATGTLTYLQAADEVLRQHSPGAPLHYRRITELALEDGLIEPKGSTPEATMGSRLYSDIKRRMASGKPERFRQYGRGLFGLASPTDPLGGAVTTHNREVSAKLRSTLGEMDPQAFEHLIATLLAALEFEDVEVTKFSGDGGIDVRATLKVGGVTDVTTAVQVKRWAGNVAGRTVRELRGGLGPHERGLIITLSDFTPDARKEGGREDRTPISLVNGDQLIDLLIDNSIGVVVRTAHILELDEPSLLPPDGDSVEKADGGGAPSAMATSAGHYTGSKALAIWPLPGGRHAWKSALIGFLRTSPRLPRPSSRQPPG